MDVGAARGLLRFFDELEDPRMERLAGGSPDPGPMPGD